jgi:hypothetical protein
MFWFGVPVVLPSVVVVEARLSAPAVPTVNASPTPAAAATSARRTLRTALAIASL